MSAEPAFTVRPNSIAFPSLAVGSVSSQTIHVDNINAEPLTVTSVSLSGRDASDFRVGPDACTGVTLAGGATCAVTVSFAPTSPGHKHGSLSVSVDGGASGAPRIGKRSISHDAVLHGTAIPAPPPTISCRGVKATIVGTRGADTLRGTAGRDVVAGLAGNDFLRGLRGNDVICGGPGRDRLNGGHGADRLIGGSGADLLNGGPGPDRQAH